MNSLKSGASALLLLIACFLSKEFLLEKSPETIFKEARYACAVRYLIILGGKNQFDIPLTAALDAYGSCFATKDFRGQTRIITNAHLFRDHPLKRQSFLYVINQKTANPAQIWKEITNIETQTLAVTFKNRNPKFYEDQDPNYGLKFEGYPANLEPALDLAEIKLIDESLYCKIKPGKLGDSDKLEVGEVIYSIGNPGNHSFVFLAGQISHFHTKAVNQLKYYEIFTSEISGEGNSGGPLINKYGQIVGMNQRYNARNPHLSDFISANTIKKYLSATHSPAK